MDCSKIENLNVFRLKTLCEIFCIASMSCINVFNAHMSEGYPSEGKIPAY